MEDKTIIAIAAITAIAILEGLNIVFFGLDSSILALVLTTISGIAGYTFAKSTSESS